MSEFLIADVTPGKLNALVKNIMKQTGIDDPKKAVRTVNSGNAVVVLRENLVDLVGYNSAPPFCPEGFEVVEHRKEVQLNWDPANVGLYLSEEQKTGSIHGQKLLKHWQTQPVLNANALDYYLANTHLIPEEWKGLNICFPGTIFKRKSILCVNCLKWNGSRWNSTIIPIHSTNWADHIPAAVALPAS